MNTAGATDAFRTALDELDPTLDDGLLGDFIYTSEFTHDPYPLYRYLREVKPVWYCERMGGWILTRHADIAAALKDDEIYSTLSYQWMISNLHGRTILDMRGSEHARKRGLMTPFFHGHGLDRLSDLIETTSAELVRDFAGDGQVELFSQYTKHFPIRVIARIIGIADEQAFDFEQLMGWANAIMRQTANMHGDETILNEGLAAREQFTEFMLPVIARRRAEPQDDLITHLVQAEVDGVGLTDEEVRAHCSLLLTAGWETTDKLILSTMTNLLTHPDQLEAVMADRSLVPMAIAETLRHDSVVQFLARELTADVELHGHHMKSGSPVFAAVAAGNRDDRVFANPEAYDIFRADLLAEPSFGAGGKQMGFGYGRHFCLGARLGRQETVVALNHLFDVMERPRLAPGFVPRWEGMFTRSEGSLESHLRSVRRLEIVFEPVGVAV